MCLAWFWVLTLTGQATAKPTSKRPPPRYGRPAPSAPATRVLEWPLRIALAPAWVAFELVLRKPHAALVTAVENSATLKKAQDTTSDGPWKELTVLPAARFDVGLAPLIGLNGRFRYHRSDLSVQASTWGPRYVFAQAAERFEIVPKQQIFLQTRFERRSDHPFYGLGPRSGDADRARFGASDLRVQLGYSADFWRRSHVAVALGGRGYWFGEGGLGDDPSLASAVAERRLQAPGLGLDYGAATQRAELVLDSRRELPRRGASLRAALFEESSLVLDVPGRSFLRAGGSLGTHIDLTGTRRVLDLGVHAEVAAPLRGELPFTEQIALGGDRYLLGFLGGRLLDRSATVFTAEYTWPIWVFLEGMLHAAVGNVFGRGFDGFDPRAMRYSTGLGLRSTGDAHSRLELLFALGSRPLDEGGAIDSIRFMVGTQRVP